MCCDINGIYLYRYYNKILSNLDNLFIIYNFISYLFAKVTSLEIKIGYRNPRKIFKEYYRYFLNYISPL